MVILYKQMVDGSIISHSRSNSACLASSLWTIGYFVWSAFYAFETFQKVRMVLDCKHCINPF